MDNQEKRQQTIADARRMLDWLESHPEIELPYDLTNGLMIAGSDTKDELASVAKAFGTCEKEFIDDVFRLRKRFGSVSIYAFAARKQVCERVVVGTEDVPERVVPAFTREIVEWRCVESLMESKDAETVRIYCACHGQKESWLLWD